MPTCAGTFEVSVVACADRRSNCLIASHYLVLFRPPHPFARCSPRLFLPVGHRTLAYLWIFADRVFFRSQKWSESSDPLRRRLPLAARSGSGLLCGSPDPFSDFGVRHLCAMSFALDRWRVLWYADLMNLTLLVGLLIYCYEFIYSFDGTKEILCLAKRITRLIYCHRFEDVYLITCPSM